MPQAVAMYSHRLKDSGNKRLEEKINRMFSEYAQLRHDPKDRDRARTLLGDILILLSRHFTVVGQDLEAMEHQTSFDEIMDDILIDALKEYDPSRGLFTHFLRYRYKKNRLSEAMREDKRQRSLVEFRDMDAHPDADAADSDWQDDDEHGGVEERLGDADAADSGWRYDGRYSTPGYAGEADEMCKAVVVSKVLSLLDSYLEGLGTNPETQRTRLYFRMIFTERMTYSVKVTPVFEDCEPLEAEEALVFHIVEVGFLDVFMAGICRTIRQLWDTPLRDGYGKIIKRDDPRMQRKNPPAEWKLRIDVYLGYLKKEGIGVSSAVISQNRKKFTDLYEKLTTFA